MTLVVPLWKKWKSCLHSYTLFLYIYASAARQLGPRFDLPETEP